MNFEFSEEQLFIRDQARNFLSQESSAEVVRSVLDTDLPFHRGLWQQIVELGWTAMAIPESFGGLGLGYLELCVIAEELGRSLAPVPFSSSVYLATEAIKSWGSAEQQQHYLPRLASGELIGTLASSEGPGALEINAVIRGEGLRGSKLPVPDGDVADFALVVARSEDGIPGLYLVDLAVDGVSRSVLTTMDPSRSQARLDFDGAPAQRLGEHAIDGLAALDQLFDRAAVLFAFEQIGGAQAALDMGISGDQAQVRRHVRGPGTGTGQRLLRGLGPVQRRPGPAAGGSHRPGFGDGRLLPGLQGEHPGSRWHGFYLGVRLSPVLPTGATAVHRHRYPALLERGARHAPAGSRLRRHNHGL
jgi:alkylation response protein AidB-like acyl-CoA dehydrogenase